MYYYMLIPFALLAVMIGGYLLLRRYKTGAVIYRVKRILVSRENFDLMVSFLLICGICFLFGWSDLKQLKKLIGDGITDLTGMQVYGGRALFYLILIIVFLIKQLERPAVRESGISSARWFWSWDRIKFYRWRGTLLEFKINRGNKQLTERWPVIPEQKKELDRLLRQKVKKKVKKSKG